MIEKLALSSQAIERFWSKVNIGRPNECWEWQARRQKEGYGIFHLGRRHIVASMLACTLAHGERPNGCEACHTCDNPACANPAHLFWGTHAQNMADASHKRRMHGPHLCGERNGRAKLTMEQVKEIKRRGDSQRRLAAEFGVDRTTIRNIVKGKIWQHV